MAKSPAPSAPSMVSYFVLDENAKKETALGGVAITQEGDNRKVLMTPSQAKYWLDQGTIALALPKAKPPEAPAPAPAPVPETPTGDETSGSEGSGPFGRRGRR